MISLHYTRYALSAAIATIAMVTVPSAFAAIIAVQHGDTVVGDRTSNLILNGSFENRIGPAGDVSWTGVSGSRLVYSPTVASYSIPHWEATGDAESYGVWGSFFGAPPGPADGQYEVYFGNYLTSPTSSYVVNPDGTATFASPPTFINSSSGILNPVTLSQKVDDLTVGASYWLDFYTTGEFEPIGPFIVPGIFGLQISGEPLLYLRTADDIANSAFGTSERYQVEFTATASSLTFQWINWGHVCTPVCGSELILDDVILNAHMGSSIPEPTTFALVGVGIAAACFVRRRRGVLTADCNRKEF